MNFSALTTYLKLNISDFNRGLNRAQKGMEKFSKQANSFLINLDGKLTEASGGLDELSKSMHNVGLGARDVGRIVSGILISQTFYRGAEAIRAAAEALWDFNKQLDYANVTYSTLFNSTDIASSFLNQLQQYSVNTMFQFTDLENMSRKLLAYGIEYKNLMYVVQGLTNVGTLSGDSAALERLALAIGQINAKGTLKAEEVRQLTNAYVPMYDILREKFGLSDADFKSIGDLGLKSADVINAIVEYSNEKFGNMANAAMMTIEGLNQKIADSFKVVGASMMEPVSKVYKSLAFYIATELQNIQDIYNKSGAGGVFEHLVPNEEAQELIRAFIANFINGLYRIAGVFAAVWPLIRGVLFGLLNGLNIINAAFNFAASMVVGALESIGIHTNTIELLSRALYYGATAFMVYKAAALGLLIIDAVRLIVIRLGIALTSLASVIIAHPIIFFMLAISAAIVGITGKANGARSALAGLVQQLNKFSLGGKTSNDILQPDYDYDKGKDDATDFYEQISDKADEAADATEDASKRASKSLLSFDEVFRLNDDQSSGLASGLSDLGDLAEGLGAYGDALIPEVPDLSDFADNFVSTLYNELWNSIKHIASGATYGAIIGALVGFAIGAFITGTPAGAIAMARLGAQVGAILGAGFATFWKDAYKEMEGSIAKIAMGGGIGALVGGLVGFVLGALSTRDLKFAITAGKIGAGVGGLLGAGIGGFWAAATEEVSNAIEGIAVGGSTGVLIGALAGFIFGAFAGPAGLKFDYAMKGAAIGASLGSLVGAAIGGIWGSLSSSMKRAVEGLAVSTSMGTLIGALAGFAIGAFVGPAGSKLNTAMAGAKIGAAIGALMGAGAGQAFAATEDGVRDGVENMFSGVQAASYGALIGGLAGMIIGALIGAFAGAGIGALPGAKIGATIGAALGTLGGLVYDKLNEAGIIEAIANWFGNLANSISQWWSSIWDFSGVVSGWNALSSWFSNLWTSIATWFTTTKNSIKVLWNSIYNYATNGWSSGWSSVSGWFISLWSSISSWYTDKKNATKVLWNSLYSYAANGWSTGWSRVTGWFSALASSIHNWFSNYKRSIASWFVDMFATNGWASGWSKLTSWFNNILTSIRNWFTNLKTSIKNWWRDLWSLGNVSILGSGIAGLVSGGVRLMVGHADGGIFNREHIARFAEGNKAEAVIPLQNDTAMKPFVDSVSNGVISSLAPLLAGNSNNNSDTPPMYVGTLIADERGLKELYKKFNVIKKQEDSRRLGGSYGI